MKRTVISFILSVLFIGTSNSQEFISFSDDSEPTISESEKKPNGIISSLLLGEILKKVESTLEDDNMDNKDVLLDYEKKATDLNEWQRILANSYLAELLNNYLNKNYIDLSKTKESKRSDDFNTWSVNQLQSYISKLYMNSVENSKDMVIKFDSIKPYLFPSELRRQYHSRSTFRSQLVSRALSHFIDVIKDEGIVHSEFSSLGKTIFGSASEFTSVIDNKPRTETNLDNILYLYKVGVKDIRRYNLEAGVRYDIERLQFLNDININPSADDTYLNVLTSAIEEYDEPKLKLHYIVARATLLEKLGRNTEALKAYEDAEAILIPGNLRLIANNGSNRLLHKELSIDSEWVYSSKQKPVLELKSRNIDEVFIRVIKITQDFYQDLLDSYQNGHYNIMNQSNIIKEWSVKLDKNNHELLSKDISLEPLPYGMYTVIVSNDKNFSRNYERISYTVFNVSDLAYIKTMQSGKDQIVVMDRLTGEPLKKASIIFSRLKYSAKKQRMAPYTYRTFFTNENGEVTIPETETTGYTFKVVNAKDTLDLREFGNFRSDLSKRRSTYLSKIFTEKETYFPGEKVNYNGIVSYVSEDHSQEYYAGKELKITLGNNAHRIGQKTHTSDNYGSFAGSFDIKENTPGGAYYISVRGFSKRIEVKGYSPVDTELISFSSVENNLTTSDTMEVNVLLKTKDDDTNRYFYNVTRAITPANKTSEKKINLIVQARTEIKPSSKEFTIKIPNPKDGVISDYQIVVDVLDKKDRFLSFKKTFIYPQEQTKYQADIGELIDQNQIKTVTIRSLDANNNPTTSEARVLLYSENCSLGEKSMSYWTTVQSNYRIQNTKELVLDTIIVIKNQHELDLSKYVKHGKYELSIPSTYPDGRDNFSKLFSYIAYEKPFYIEGKKKKYYVGEHLNIEVKSSISDIHCNYFIVRNHDIISKGYLNLAKQNKVTYQIQEQDKGGIQLVLVSAKDNRLYQHNIEIHVPRKQISISVAEKDSGKLEISFDPSSTGANTQVIARVIKEGKLKSNEFNKALYHCRQNELYLFQEGYGHGMNRYYKEYPQQYYKDHHEELKIKEYDELFVEKKFKRGKEFIKPRKKSGFEGFTPNQLITEMQPDFPKNSTRTSLHPKNLGPFVDGLKNPLLYERSLNPINGKVILSLPETNSDERYILQLFAYDKDLNSGFLSTKLYDAKGSE